MNKYQEALEDTRLQFKQLTDYSFGLTSEYYLLKELVDRANPMKPIYRKVVNNDCCPVCDYIINNVNFIFCPYCGQAIDWSDEIE